MPQAVPRGLSSADGPRCRATDRPKAELSERQATPAGRAKLRERVQVEHALAHIGHWQGRRARYTGTRKNLFDLRGAAVVCNLHISARQATNDDHQLVA